MQDAWQRYPELSYTCSAGGELNPASNSPYSVPANDTPMIALIQKMTKMKEMEDLKAEMKKMAICDSLQPTFVKSLRLFSEKTEKGCLWMRTSYFSAHNCHNTMECN